MRKLISLREIFPERFADNPPDSPDADTDTAPTEDENATGFEIFPTVPPATRLIPCPAVTVVLLVFVKIDPVVVMETLPGAEAWITVRSPVVEESMEPEGKL